ncbi:hypothetical protein C6P45_001437 [Maudiozyma exigua]|uniref:Uncharacterized protein n=1 Tax=Maudiozyma exigua TaxID=34358 RepID=A0A9P7B685_MAUEX|nr:hypothetical protein C6P45_001437 [Kazachstania exigua]
MTFYPMAFEESIRFIYCDGGKNLQEKIIIQEDQTSDAYWNETFELTFVDPSTKLKFSRRQGFVNHDKSYVVPGSIIGGLFHCFDDSCNSENSEPMLPVYSYMHESMWTQTTRGNSLYNWTLEKYIPLMSTTNDYFRSNKLKQLVAGHNRHRIADIYEKIAKARTQNITRTCTENWCVMI